MKLVLTAKPKVHKRNGRYGVLIEHLNGEFDAGPWKTHAAAMNCGRAIARSSDWRLPIEHVNASGDPVQGWGTWKHL